MTMLLRNKRKRRL